MKRWMIELKKKNEWVDGWVSEWLDFGSWVGEEQREWIEKEMSEG